MKFQKIVFGRNAFQINTCHYLVGLLEILLLRDFRNVFHDQNLSWMLTLLLLKIEWSAIFFQLGWRCKAWKKVRTNSTEQHGNVFEQRDIYWAGRSLQITKHLVELFPLRSFLLLLSVMSDDLLRNPSVDASYVWHNAGTGACFQRNALIPQPMFHHVDGGTWSSLHAAKHWKNVFSGLG